MARIKSIAALGATVVMMATLAACGNSDDSSGGANPGATTKHGLPSEYASGFTVPLINYPPYSIIDDNGKISGFDHDIAVALSDYFGVKLSEENSTFENSLLGVTQGKYTWAPAASITAERRQTYDFVSYFQDSYQLAVRTDAPDVGTEPTDMCGLSIGLVNGDYTIPYLTDLSKQCESDGLDPIDVKTYADRGGMQVAVTSGRLDAIGVTQANGTYTLSQDGGLKLTGPEFGTTTEGLTLKKDSDLAEPLKDALNALIADGTYAKILDKYDLAQAAVAQAEVNPESAE